MTAIDVVTVAGQSNAKGNGDSTLSTTVTVDAYDLSNGAITPLADPVGPADTGSLCPALAEAFATGTGRSVAIVSTGVGGTALQPEAAGASGDWSPSDTIFSDCIFQTRRALAVLTDAGWSPTLRGVVWAQGERDAQHHPVAAGYAVALAALADRFQQWLELVNLPLYVVQTGTFTTTGVEADYRQIREAQRSVCAGDPDVIMAYADAVNFPAYGWMADNVHYNQEGLNAIGAAVAAVMLATLRTPTPPTLIDGTASIFLSGNEIALGEMTRNP